MNVKIACTKTCSHRPNLEAELRALGIPYQLVFIEDEPNLVQDLGLRTSPNLLVDDVVVFRRQPTEDELRSLFNLQ